MGRVASLLATIGYPLNGEHEALAPLLTPTEVRAVLDAHGLAPRRSSGQNFVVDPNTVRRIVAAADLSPDDLVIEIGPGLGSLTVALATRVRRVVAIEVDRGLVRALREILERRGPELAGRVEVVHADAMTVDFAQFGRGRIVANLPYNVATPLVMHALEADVIDDLFVMVQREVGERWIAPPGSRARAGVSVKLDHLVRANIVMAIPRQVFLPVPNVDSVMVRLVRRSDDEMRIGDGEGRRRWTAFVDAAFAQRRKTLRNAWGRRYEAGALEAAAETAGVDLGARAETVSTDNFLTMFEALDGLLGCTDGSVVGSP